MTVRLSNRLTVPTHPSPQRSTLIRWRAPLGRRVSKDEMMIQTYSTPYGLTAAAAARITAV